MTKNWQTYCTKQNFFYLAEALCSLFGCVSYIINSRNYLSSSIIPKFVLVFLVFSGLTPIFFIMRGITQNSGNESGLGRLLKHKATSVFIYVVSIIVLAILFSAPEGIKTTYYAIYIRIEPVLYYLVAQCIVLLLATLSQQFSESTQSSFLRFVTDKYKGKIFPILIFLFPFFFYFPRTIPINNIFTGIGNDFIPITYSHKVFLLDYLSRFQIPLWSPGEGAGFPFYSSPHTQSFYPFNIILATLYKLNGGYSVLDHQRFTILGIMIFALGLYYWLGLFRFNRKTVIALALILPCTYKIAELQRYSLATHSAAWYPWILYAISLMFLNRRSKDLWKPALILFFSLVSIFTAGYPYYVYYLIFLVLPFALILLVSRNKISVFNQPVVLHPVNFLFLFGSAIASIAVVGPYILKMVQLMNQTSGRTGNSLDFVAGHPFTAMDTLGSLIFPPSAQAEGWYYFGIILFLILCWFLIDFVFHHVIRKHDQISADMVVILLLLIFVILTSWITYGVDSALFIFLWKYLPFFSSLRTWGRLNIVTLLLITPILGFALEAFRQNLEFCKDNKRSAIQTILLLTGIGVVIGIIQTYLLQNQLFNPYWSRFFYYFSGTENSYVVKTILISILVLILIWIGVRRPGVAQQIFLPIVVVVSVLDLWPCSSSMWKGTEFNIENDKRKTLHISQRIIPESLKYPRTDALMAADVALTPKFFVGYADDWYFDRYREFFLSHSFEKEARSKLLAVTSVDRLFLTAKLDYSAISDFLQDSEKFSGEVDVEKYSGDVMLINVNAPRDGYISFIDNWDPAWIATVNGQPATVEVLFGTFKSVRIPIGQSQVKFEYRPFR